MNLYRTPLPVIDWPSVATVLTVEQSDRYGQEYGLEEGDDHIGWHVSENGNSENRRETTLKNIR